MGDHAQVCTKRSRLRKSICKAPIVDWSKLREFQRLLSAQSAADSTVVSYERLTLQGKRDQT